MSLILIYFDIEAFKSWKDSSTTKRNQRWGLLNWWHPEPILVWICKEHAIASVSVLTDASIVMAVSLKIWPKVIPLRAHDSTGITFWSGFCSTLSWQCELVIKLDTEWWEVRTSAWGDRAWCNWGGWYANHQP